MVTKILLILLILVLLAVAAVLAVDRYVSTYGEKYIVSEADAQECDAIIILGALVYGDGSVSPVLQYRLDTGLALYNDGKAKKIIVSGDHGTINYNEVRPMMAYLMERGVPREDIFMDHAGFDTYDSMYRMRDIFLVKSAIVVSQNFHNVRALYIGRKLGMEVYGVDAPDDEPWTNIIYYRIREYGARMKAFAQAGVFKPKPKYLGEAIPIYLDGTHTDDGK